jgi:hypothetical protein
LQSLECDWGGASRNAACSSLQPTTPQNWRSLHYHSEHCCATARGCPSPEKQHDAKPQLLQQRRIRALRCPLSSADVPSFRKQLRCRSQSAGQSGAHVVSMDSATACYCGCPSRALRAALDARQLVVAAELRSSSSGVAAASQSSSWGTGVQACDMTGADQT